MSHGAALWGVTKGASVSCQVCRAQVLERGTKGTALEMQRGPEYCVKLAHSCLLRVEFVLKVSSGSSAFHCSASPSLSESHSTKVPRAVSPQVPSFPCMKYHGAIPETHTSLEEPSQQLFGGAAWLCLPAAAPAAPRRARRSAGKRGFLAHLHRKP